MTIKETMINLCDLKEDLILFKSEPGLPDFNKEITKRRIEAIDIALEYLNKHKRGRKCE